MRRKTRDVIQKAYQIYELILEISKKRLATTNLILEEATKKKILDDYGNLYYILRILEKKGLVESSKWGRKLVWEATKVVNHEKFNEIIL